MSTCRTTGPIYVEPRNRHADNLFGLLLSNMVGDPIEVRVEVFAAPFTSVGSPEAWTRIIDKRVPLPDNTVANLAFPLRRECPYYQFFVHVTGPIVCFHPALYLLDNLANAVQDFPLLPSADWEPSEKQPID